tara:strand:- start:247 stop:489 length:243 start_codon:yes stop_codon:yes gene_type:complete
MTKIAKAAAMYPTLFFISTAYQDPLFKKLSALLCFVALAAPAPERRDSADAFDEIKSGRFRADEAEVGGNTESINVFQPA